MRIVLQRVSRAKVTVDGRVTGEIGRGLLLLAGFTDGDTDEALAWMAKKVVQLRIFPDDAGKGNRSSFIDAARPEVAVPLYERFVEMLRAAGRPVATGEFGAMMDVE